MTMQCSSTGRLSKGEDQKFICWRPFRGGQGRQQVWLTVENFGVKHSQWSRFYVKTNATTASRKCSYCIQFNTTQIFWSPVKIIIVVIINEFKFGPHQVAQMIMLQGWSQQIRSCRFGFLMAACFSWVSLRVSSHSVPASIHSSIIIWELF